LPTATQKLGETQDTPTRWVYRSGLGLGTADQAVPSHISATVVLLVGVGWGGVNICSEPTATQKLVETQDTPLRSFSFGSGEGLGLGTTDQVVPSHISTRVPGPGKLVLPTATQKLVERQDTPLRRLAPVPGLGLGTTDQLVPATPPVSMRVWPTGLPLLM
jgi:hypothetical protein